MEKMVETNFVRILFTKKLLIISLFIKFHEILKIAEIGKVGLLLKLN